MIRCLISTVAFGMRIDIPDIRIACHWGESECVAQFWQEVGRTGRDGEPADAHLYHRQQKLSLCKQDMRDLIVAVKNDSCIRETILATLHIEGMTIFQQGSQNDKCKCCCNCSRTCHSYPFSFYLFTTTIFFPQFTQLSRWLSMIA